MSRQFLHFLLVPDGSAARRLRRVLAKKSACSGIVVGTWPELMNRACSAYLVPETTDNNDSGFRKALEELEDAFWTESLSVAPVETGEAVKSALIQIVSATDPTSDTKLIGTDALPERPRRHLSDLFRLNKLEGQWPKELSIMQSLLMAGSEDALHPIRVYHNEDISQLTRWQANLIEKLNRDAEKFEGGRDEELLQIFNDVLSGDFAGKPRSALRFLQEWLFVNDVKDKTAIDESVNWVGTRDFLQEAEVAAGMVQSILAAYEDVEPSDIGLLMPDRLEYVTALEDTFAHGGIALSGLPAERLCRNLGGEVVFNFLYCREKPAPAMALATCLSSPLMPWSRKFGAKLAQKVMDGDYHLCECPSASSDEENEMLELLRGGDSEPASLVIALTEFVSLLQGHSKEFGGHVKYAKKVVEQLKDSLENAASIDWTELRRTVSTRFITSGESPDFNLEGLTVWRESQEAWRPVKHLIVLGFTQGHYPATLSNNSVFSAEDLRSIRERMDLSVSTPSDLQESRRKRFKRQLGTVFDTVTFLVSHRDPRGEEQSPSESLVFMHQLFDDPQSVDERIIEIDIADDRARMTRHLAIAASASPQAPRALLAEDLNFGRNLLDLRVDSKGQPKPESPSSLERLMVSRLAWLLHRLNAEPLQWVPESANAALLGTLAHKVFEGLFHPGEKLPDSREIERRVETLLEDAITQRAPFLQASQWQVERKHFVSETCKAARAWREVLDVLGAEVLATEPDLQGMWSGIGIHGQADLLLGLPRDGLLVVDYKRSKSDNRHKLMENGFDSQASLYRAMLESGGPKDKKDKTLLSSVRNTTGTGIVYYMLNDQVALSDMAPLQSDAVPGWETLENDVASKAMSLIERRINEVRAGEVRLNRDGDAEYFKKKFNTKPYTLEKSPLINLFTVPGEAEESQ